jgi:CcmD family protein
MNAEYVAGAYGFIWLAFLGYVVVLARRTRRVHEEIEELRRKLERKAPG